MLLVFLSTFLSFAAILVLFQTSLQKRQTSASAMRLRRVTEVRGQMRGAVPCAHLRRLAGQCAAWVRSRTGLLKEDAVRRKLVEAGLTQDLAPDVYTTVRFAAIPFGVLVGALLPHGRPLGVVLTPAILSVCPDLVVRHLAKRRKKSIRRSMPDLVDLLVICVDAGLGLDQAAIRVAEELAVSHPATHDELLQVGGEQRAGKPRMQAWEDFAKRLNLPEVDAFVSMLVQADRFGTPIARALSNFAQTMRLRRTQKAEEQAAKTTIKILFPLVLFLFPTIFIVLLGPAVLTMVRSFAGGLR